MAAIDSSLVARSEAAVHHFAKRNWAAEEPGVIVVFAIIGCVAILVIGLFVQKKVRRDVNFYFRSRLIHSEDGCPQSILIKIPRRAGG
jgi:hypothetical protein